MIAYSQCWEDSDLVLEALQIDENDQVVSITSGGCNTIAIALKNPEIVYAIDSNREQNYLLEHKLAAIKNMPIKDAIAYMGYQSDKNRIEQFNSISNNLSAECKTYWQNLPEAIREGIAHSGKFEKYIALFRKRIIPLVHTKKRIKQLLALNNSQEQTLFYNRYWNTFRWKLQFRIFFSKWFMRGRGRKKEMFAHTNIKSVGKKYYQRTQDALTKGPVHTNFYLHYILLKNNPLLPPYLLYLLNSNSNIPDNINIITSDMLSFLQSMEENSISKFNLSDIFEPLSPNEADTVFNEILRVAKSGARLIFWNNLVEREIPAHLQDKFQFESELVKKFAPKDNVFFYEKFLIYTVAK